MPKVRSINDMMITRFEMPGTKPGQAEITKQVGKVWPNFSQLQGRASYIQHNQQDWKSWKEYCEMLEAHQAVLDDTLAFTNLVKVRHFLQQELKSMAGRVEKDLRTAKTRGDIDEINFQESKARLLRIAADSLDQPIASNWPFICDNELPMASRVTLLEFMLQQLNGDQWSPDSQMQVVAAAVFAEPWAILDPETKQVIRSSQFNRPQRGQTTTTTKKDKKATVEVPVPAGIQRDEEVSGEQWTLVPLWTKDPRQITSFFNVIRYNETVPADCRIEIRTASM